MNKGRTMKEAARAAAKREAKFWTVAAVARRRTPSWATRASDGRKSDGHMVIRKGVQVE